MPAKIRPVESAKSSPSKSSKKLDAASNSAPVKRGPDDPELAFLGSRQQATPLHSPVIRKTVADLKARVIEGDRASAVQVALDGGDLTTVYMRHGDATLGYESFRAFLVAEWPLSVSSAYDRMRIVRFTTDAQLRKYRFSKCKLGVRLASVCGLSSLAELETTPIQLPAGFAETTVSFASATCEQLAAALRLQKAPKAEVIPVKKGTELTEKRAWVRGQSAADAEIAALDPVVFMRDGEIHLRVTIGPQGATAAARLCSRLARLK